MRERLIGATVLVVIAVILVPWLVSRAHHPEDVVTHTAWPAGTATAQQPYVLPLQATRTVAAAATHARTVPASDPTAGMPAATAEPERTASKSAPKSAPEKAAGNRPVAGSGTTAPQAPAIAQGWNIQAASFSDISAARALAAKLRQAGFNAALSSHAVKGTTYYQVRVGPYDTEKRARDAAPGVARISNTKVLVRAPGGGNG